MPPPATCSAIRSSSAGLGHIKPGIGFIRQPQRICRPQGQASWLRQRRRQRATSTGPAALRPAVPACLQRGLGAGIDGVGVADKPVQLRPVDQLRPVGVGDRPSAWPIYGRSMFVAAAASGSRPAMVRRSVDLPLPLRPRSRVTSPPPWSVTARPGSAVPRASTRHRPGAGQQARARRHQWWRVPRLAAELYRHYLVVRHTYRWFYPIPPPPQRRFCFS